MGRPAKSSGKTNPQIRSRGEIHDALKQAAHLEHGLACLYLFAAFSLRKTLSDFPPSMRGDKAKRMQCELIMNQNRLWEKQILLVARQEMEHLGIDQNLLNAIGEAPYMIRPNFPIPANSHAINIPYHLERFSKQTIARFVQFEKPDYLEFTAGQEPGKSPDPKCNATHWKADNPLLKTGLEYTSVERLYEALLNAIKTLPGLFIGDSQKQVTTDAVGLEGRSPFQFRIEYQSTFRVRYITAASTTSNPSDPASSA